MKGTRIQRMSRQVVTLVFMVCRLWRQILGGATAREHPAPNPRNGPFRPTFAALSSTRCSPASSWTSSYKSKKDFKFEDVANSSSRTRSRSPRPSMSRRLDPLPQQDIFISRLQPGILSEPKDEIAAIEKKAEDVSMSAKKHADEFLAYSNTYQLREQLGTAAGKI